MASCRTAVVAACLLLAVAASASKPVPLVADDAAAFLEMGLEVGPTCKPGFKCPIVDGQCCANGQSCCPQRCVAVGLTTFECRQSIEEEQQRNLYEAFLRKRELDKREDTLAAAERATEQKELARIAHEKEIADWTESVRRDAEARHAVWSRKIFDLRQRLAALAKHLGVSEQSLMTRDAALFNPDKPGAANEPEVPYEDRTACGLLPTSPCQLANVYAAAGEPFDVPRLEKWEQRDICFLSGSVQGPIRKGESGSELLTLTRTSNCIPDGGRLYFPALLGGSVVVMELDTKGKVTVKDYVGREQESGKPILNFHVAYSVKNGSAVLVGKKANWNPPLLESDERSPYLTNIADLCMLSGRIHQSARAKTVNWDLPAADLAKLCQPQFDKVFVVIGEGVDSITKKAAQLPIMMNEFRNNTVVPVAQKTNLINIRTSFDGMAWITNKGTQLTLAPEGAWEVDSTVSSPTEATFTRIGSVVTLSGRLRNGKSSLIGELPPNFRPYKGTHVFVVAADNGPARIEVSSSGRVACPDFAGRKWVSLDGVTFAAPRSDKEAVDVEENDIDVVEAKRRGISAPELRPTGPNLTPASPGVEEAKRAAELQEAGQVVAQIQAVAKAEPKTS